MKKLILVGAGGHTKSIIDSIQSAKKYEIIGIIDKTIEDEKKEIGIIPIIGSDEMLFDLYHQQGIVNAFVSVGSIGNTTIRERLQAQLKRIGFKMPNIIDPTAVISQKMSLTEGIFVGKGVIVNTDCVVEPMAILNTGSVIEHDCHIGRFSHISPGATLCGNVSIGDFTHVGANATIIQGVKVGQRSLIGAGSVVIHDVDDGQKIAGNPGIIMK
ncbi:MAG: acetyltransferase [Eubacterium sp.]